MTTLRATLNGRMVWGGATLVALVFTARALAGAESPVFENAGVLAGFTGDRVH